MGLPIILYYGFVVSTILNRYLQGIDRIAEVMEITDINELITLEDAESERSFLCLCKFNAAHYLQLEVARAYTLFFKVYRWALEKKKR